MTEGTWLKYNPHPDINKYKEEWEINNKAHNAKKIINIEKFVNNKDFEKFITSIERNKKCNDRCVHCAYKEIDTGLCYYTMITNNNRTCDDRCCKHFVDLTDQKIIDKIIAYVKGHNKN